MVGGSVAPIRLRLVAQELVEHPGRNAGVLQPGREGMPEVVGPRETDEEFREALDRLRRWGCEYPRLCRHTVTHSLYIDVQPERWREDPELVVAQPRPLAPYRAAHLADPAGDASTMSRMEGDRHDGEVRRRSAPVGRCGAGA
jgi:hypothetical protein